MIFKYIGNLTPKFVLKHVILAFVPLILWHTFESHAEIGHLNRLVSEGLRIFPLSFIKEIDKNDQNDNDQEVHENDENAEVTLSNFLSFSCAHKVNRHLILSARRQSNDHRLWELLILMLFSFSFFALVGFFFDLSCVIEFVFCLVFRMGPPLIKNLLALFFQLEFCTLDWDLAAGLSQAVLFEVLSEFLVPLVSLEQLIFAILVLLSFLEAVFDEMRCDFFAFLDGHAGVILFVCKAEILEVTHFGETRGTGHLDCSVKLEVHGRAREFGLANVSKRQFSKVVLRRMNRRFI